MPSLPLGLCSSPGFDCDVPSQRIDRLTEKIAENCTIWTFSGEFGRAAFSTPLVFGNSGLFGQGQMNPQFFAVNQFILDATEAAARLDVVISQRDQDMIFRALQRGQQDYAALLATRDALPTQANDTALLNILLDNLQARMNFLHSRI